MRKGCRTTDVTGQPMRGFVSVEHEGRKSEKDLTYWLELALACHYRVAAPGTQMALAYNPTAKKSASRKRPFPL